MFDNQTWIRLRTALLAGFDYLINVLVLFAFAAVGTLPLRIPLVVLLLSVLINAVVIGAIASGASRRLKDPSLTSTQVGVALAVNLFGLAIAPQVAYLFVTNLFIPLAYASLNFRRSTFLLIGPLLSASVCLILWLGAPFQMALSRPAEQLLFFAVLTLVLARYGLINGEISRLRERLQRQNRALGELNERLTALASHDELTGLINRRQFHTLLADEIGRAKRSGEPFSVALIDVDHFKQVNDRFGHSVGDEALRQLAQVMEQSLRGPDQVARYGGEEFVALLVGANGAQALDVIERLRVAVVAHDWPALADGLRLTISAGIAQWRPGISESQLLSAADRALYCAKADGRNCLRLAHCQAD